MVIDPAIDAHYGTGYERSRLFPGGQPSLEYVRSMELLERLLPAPPARVLDVGGGPGTYAAPLARRGYRVHLVDPVPLHVVSRFASLLDGLYADWLDDPVFGPIVDQDLADGQRRNPDPAGRPQFFTTAYFHTPDGLAGEIEQAAAGSARGRPGRSCSPRIPTGPGSCGSRRSPRQHSARIPSLFPPPPVPARRSPTPGGGSRPRGTGNP
jgi:Methyltransferase domain